MIATLYAAFVRRRRERYAARPDLRRRLRRPVISVGNLATGGRGKTPTVACIARLLLEAGERPAILSRGYARGTHLEGVVIVRDALDIRTDLERAGDEPLMLARRLPGVCVLVSSDRYLAGTLAEHHLGATVHVLDDGFQHLQLDRDVDIVIVGAEDLDPRASTLPSGHLREHADSLIVADAVLALDDRAVALLGEPHETPFRTFRLVKRIGEPVFEPEPPDGRTAVGVAGIAAPDRFFEDVRASGWTIARRIVFRDHHRYVVRDVARLWREAEEAGVRTILTTEKDYVRLLPYRPFPMPVGYLPLTMEPDPLPEFRQWLGESLDAARDIIR